MTSAVLEGSTPHGERFRHEALFYAGMEEFLERTSTLVREGVGAGEPTMVAVSAEKIDALRAELGSVANDVNFADMAKVGRNPAAIIPVWRDFRDRNSEGPLRGIGEPVWPGRSSEELVECERHEALLNLAFADGPAWWLTCPYDVSDLTRAVLERARHTHPFIWENEGHRTSTSFDGLEAAAGPFDRPLAEPPGPYDEMTVSVEDLSALRAFVAGRGRATGMVEAKVADLALAVSEVGANSVRYGGGEGRARIWETAEGVVCEIADAGHLADPFAGRRRPAPDQTAGFGLWLVNQICDLVEIRSLPTGSVVRVHMSRR